MLIFLSVSASLDFLFLCVADDTIVWDWFWSAAIIWFLLVIIFLFLFTDNSFSVILFWSWMFISSTFFDFLLAWFWEVKLLTFASWKDFCYLLLKLLLLDFCFFCLLFFWLVSHFQLLFLISKKYEKEFHIIYIKNLQLHIICQINYFI